MFCERLAAVGGEQWPPIAFTAYRTDKGEWIGESGIIVDDEVLKGNLGWTLESKAPWREQSSREVYFPVIEFDAVVVGTFSSAPKKGTRDKVFDKIILETARQATNAYKLAHDNLTGLLNEAEFDRQLRSALTRHPIISEAATQAVDQEQSGTSVALMALDIDFFKQVNDTHGHAYGNCVLNALGLRLEKSCQAVELDNPGRVKFHCARPHGEEFFIIAKGRLTGDDGFEFADKIRQAVSDEPLPNDSEWDQITQADLNLGLPLPRRQERNLTVSIGLSFIPAVPHGRFREIMF